MGTKTCFLFGFFHQFRNLHSTLRRQLIPIVKRVLHDLIEHLVAHMSREQQLRRAEPVQRQRLYARYVHAQLSVTAGTLDADDYAEVC